MGRREEEAVRALCEDRDSLTAPDAPGDPDEGWSPGTGRGQGRTAAACEPVRW